MSIVCPRCQSNLRVLLGKEGHALYCKACMDLVSPGWDTIKSSKEQILEKIVKRLRAMSTEDLEALIEKHKDGDVAKAVRGLICGYEVSSAQNFYFTGKFYL